MPKITFYFVSLEYSFLIEQKSKKKNMIKWFLEFGSHILKENHCDSYNAILIFSKSNVCVYVCVPVSWSGVKAFLASEKKRSQLNLVVCFEAKFSISHQLCCHLKCVINNALSQRFFFSFFSPYNCEKEKSEIERRA